MSAAIISFPSTFFSLATGKATDYVSVTLHCCRGQSCITPCQGDYMGLPADTPLTMTLDQIGFVQSTLERILWKKEDLLSAQV